MITSDFILLGHNSPLGQYPAPVVPVGTLENELVAIYATKDGSELATLSNDCSYIKHDPEQLRSLAEFDFSRHRLFALSQEKVSLYLIEQERDFFISLLSDSQFAANNPFLRLSLSKASKDASAIANALELCANEIAGRVPHYLGTWLDEEKQSILEEIDPADAPVFIDFFENLSGHHPLIAETPVSNRRTWPEIGRSVSQQTQWIKAVFQAARQPWLGHSIAAILIFSTLATHLVTSYVNTPYRPWLWLWIWLICGTIIAYLVDTVIGKTRMKADDSVSTTSDTVANEKTDIVSASGERSVAIAHNLELGTIVTGDNNTVSGIDIVARDKNIYIYQTASSTISALHQLRAPVGDFVGREHEIETLINSLRRDSRACITGISGMGGIGKTELALRVAEHLTGDYPDAQFFINLQGTDANPRPPEEVMATCIRTFRGPEAQLPEDMDQLSQHYRSELSSKRVLLLLDNVANSAQVQSLLPPPGSALLVTSRQAVILPGMTLLTLNPFTEREAQALFLEIAPQAAAPAAEICALCGYLPLAIRAAGSLLAITADLDPLEYVVQLQEQHKRLERIGMEGVEIGVAASFNLSYARLQPETALVFRLLSVFPGTFDAAAEEVICSDTDHERLSDLVRRSLVLFDASTKRYHLHDLMRLFAAAKLSKEEHASVRKCHAIYYKDVLAASNMLYMEGGATLLQGVALFDLEWGNIHAAHEWVSSQDVAAEADIAKLAIDYPDAGVFVLHLRQHAHEQISWGEIALAAARQLKDREAENNALGNLGVAYSDLGHIRRAIEFYEQTLVISREIGDRSGEATVLWNLSLTLDRLGERALALKHAEQSLTIFEQIEDPYTSKVRAKLATWRAETGTAMPERDKLD